MLVFILTIAALLRYTDATQKSYVAESSNVFTTAFLKYNKNFRPYNETQKMAVFVNMRLDFVKVLKFDRENANMQSIVDVRLSWKDGRLYWYSSLIKYITVNKTKIWTPDIDFLNVEAPPEILIDPRHLVIGSSGSVTWYRRMKITTSCEIDDELNDHSCPVTLGSMQFPVEQQDFKDTVCNFDKVLYSEHQKKINITAENQQIIYENVTGIPFSKTLASRVNCIVTIHHEPELRQGELLRYTMHNNASIYSFSYSLTLILIIISIAFERWLLQNGCI